MKKDIIVMYDAFQNHLNADHIIKMETFGGKEGGEVLFTATSSWMLETKRAAAEF